MNGRPFLHLESWGVDLKPRHENSVPVAHVEWPRRSDCIRGLPFRGCPVVGESSVVLQNEFLKRIHLQAEILPAAARVQYDVYATVPGGPGMGHLGRPANYQLPKTQSHSDTPK